MKYTLQSLCLSMLAVGLISGPLSAFADSYTDGLNAYRAKNYPKALNSFKAALQQNPNDVRSLFYMGLTYTQGGNYDKGREAFELVIQSVPPNDPIADKARNNISVITKNQITNASGSAKAAQVLNTSLSRTSKDNYLTHVIPGGKVVHFAPEKMPLKVYIGSGSAMQGWKSSLNGVVTTAMRTWSTASKGKVRFVQTYNESEADIIVKWQRNFSDNILGVSPFQMAGDTIIRSDISLATYYPDSDAPIPMEELKAIAIHEMGHAIGIKGHSPYPDDMMYYSKSRQQSNTPSHRDINTIGMLYNIEADVANNTSMSTAKTKRYYELVEKGYNAQTTNQAAQAIAYYRQAMQISRVEPDAKYNLAGLLINEGRKFIQQNNLAQAKRNYEEAVLLLQEVAQSPKTPAHTQANLDIAKKNLALVNQYLAQQQ